MKDLFVLFPLPPGLSLNEYKMSNVWKEWEEITGITIISSSSSRSSGSVTFSKLYFDYTSDVL